MDPLQDKNSGATAGGGTPPAVASNAAGGLPGNAPVPVPASKSMPLFGGKRGGKARADGLTPGSPEALAADKKKDRERKQRDREAAAKVALPPPLPPATSPPPGQQPAPVPGQQPGPASPPVEPIIPWTPDLLRPLVEVLVDENEKTRVEEGAALAKEGGLPPQVCEAVGQSFKYHAAVKTSYKLAAPAVAADVANQLGISAKYSNATVLLTALVTDRIHKRRQMAKLEKLILAAKKPKEEEKKK